MTYFNEKDPVLDIIHKHLENFKVISLSVLKNKKLNIVDLGGIKNKHGRLTMQVLIKEFAPDKYEKLGDFVKGLKEELIPKLHEEYRKSKDRSSNQKLMGFKEKRDGKPTPFDYLKDLPTDLANMGYTILNNKELLSGHEYITDFKGIFLRSPNIYSFTSHLSNYEYILEQIYEKTNELLNTKLDLNKNIKMNIIKIFKDYIIFIKNVRKDSTRNFSDVYKRQILEQKIGLKKVLQALKMLLMNLKKKLQYQNLKNHFYLK